MKKTKFTPLGIFGLACLFLAAAFLIYPAVRIVSGVSLESALHVNLAKVDKIKVEDNQLRTATITGRENVQKFLHVLDGDRLKKRGSGELNLEEINMSVELFQSGKDVGGFAFGFGSILIFKDGSNVVRYDASKYFSPDRLNEISEQYHLQRTY